MIESNSLIVKSILQKIGRGHFITLQDFGPYVSYVSLRTELVNLAKVKTIFHVAHGVYYFPEVINGKKKQPNLLDYLVWLDTNDRKIYPDNLSAKLLIENINTTSALTFSSKGKLKTTKFSDKTSITIKSSKKQIPLESYSLFVRILNAVLLSSVADIEICKTFANAYCIDEITDKISELPITFKRLLK